MLQRRKFLGGNALLAYFGLCWVGTGPFSDWQNDANMQNGRGLHTASHGRFGWVPSDQRAALASATVRAVMLTMRLTVAVGVMMCIGLLAPSSTGPMAMLPPAAVLSRL